MRFALKTLILLACISFLLWRLFPSPSTGIGKPPEHLPISLSAETPGPFPSDWFMNQRIWPDQNLSMEDFRAAVQQVERKRASSSALDDPPPWVSVGPNNIGGRITDLAAHPTNDDIVYVAAASGGIFKTTNGGGTWTPIFDAAPGMSMGALALDNFNPDIIYAGTGEANSAGYSYFGTGIYKSTDAGATWNPSGLANSRYIARIVIDPENSQRVWAAAMGELYTPSSDRGVYLSNDGGATWEQKLFVDDTTSCVDIVIHPTNSQIAYAAMWHRIRNPQNRTAGGYTSGIFRTQDGGTTWTRLTDGLPPQANNIGRIGLTICESSPNVLYAIYADDPGAFMGVYRSTDGGDSWAQTNDGDLFEMYASFGWYFGNIRVRPDNPDVVFALGVDMFRSTNGGATWEQLAWDVHVDHHAMWFDPSTPTRSWLGNDGGLYRSINNGNSWDFMTGLPINQFYAANVDFQHPERRYGGTQDNGTNRTMTGNSDDWSEVRGGDGFYVTVDPTDSDIIYCEYQNGQLVRTIDGGFEWWWALEGIDWEERTNWSTPVVMDPNDPMILYYGAERLYKTTDQAVWWDAISPDLTDGGAPGNLELGTITTIGVSPLNSQIIFVGTDDANVWSTQNGGTSWGNRSAGLPNRWVTRVTPSPHDQASVYVTISGFQNAESNAHVFFSNNYGATWTDISGDLPDVPLNDILSDPEFPNRLFVASDFGTYYTEDHGVTWQVLGENMPAVPVLDLVLHNPTRELVAATHGRSMFTLDLELLGGNQPPEITQSAPAPFDTLYIPQTVIFSVIADDPNEDSLSYVWYRNEIQIGTDPSIEINFDQVADELIEVSVSDTQYTVSHTWSFRAMYPDAANENTASVSDHLLLSVYPNPFNLETTIQYSLPEPGDLQLAIYDISGRLVKDFSKSNQRAGSAQFKWQANELASGSYFVSIRSGIHSQTQKVLLLK